MRELSPVRRLTFNLLLMSGSLVFSVLVGEVLCAVFAPSTFVRTDILGRTIAIRTFPARVEVPCEGRTYSDLSPGQQGEDHLLDDYRYQWRINSLGLRSDELSIDSMPFRVLVLGDSQTYGLGVDQEKTFPARLETLLRTDLRAPVQVMNAGVPGYGTFEALCKLTRVADEVRPRLIIVTAFVDNVLVPDEGNDLWNNLVWMRLEKGGSGGVESAAIREQVPTARATIPIFANHSHLYGLLHTIKSGVMGRETYLEKVRSYRAGNADSVELADVWQRTRQLLLEITRLGERVSGARVVLLHVPGLASLEMGDLSARDELEKAGLPLVSAFHALEGAKGASYMNLRFPHDGHYNARAHGLIARELGAYIVQNGLLD